MENDRAPGRSLDSNDFESRIENITNRRKVMDFGRRVKGVADPPDSDVSEIRGGRVINYQDIDEAVSTAWHITDGLDDTGVQSVPVTESPNIKTTGPGPHHLTEISEINEKDSRTGRITDSSDLPRAGKSFGAEQKRRINWRNSIPKSKSFKSLPHYFSV